MLLHIGLKDDKEISHGSAFHVLLLCACVTLSRGYRYNIPSPQMWTKLSNRDKQRMPHSVPTFALSNVLEACFLSWTFEQSARLDLPLTEPDQGWNGIVTCRCIFCTPAKWTLDTLNSRQRFGPVLYYWLHPVKGFHLCFPAPTTPLQLRTIHWNLPLAYHSDTLVIWRTTG